MEGRRQLSPKGSMASTVAGFVCMCLAVYFAGPPSLVFSSFVPTFSFYSNFPFYPFILFLSLYYNIITDIFKYLGFIMNKALINAQKHFFKN